MASPPGLHTAISVLPNNVKQKILAAISSSTGEAAPSLAATAAAPTSTLGSNTLQLPVLGHPAVAVIDGVLSHDTCVAATVEADALLAAMGREPGMGDMHWRDASARGDIAAWISDAELKRAGALNLLEATHKLVGIRDQLAAAGCGCMHAPAWWHTQRP